jgi:hypothetical protein
LDSLCNSCCVPIPCPGGMAAYQQSSEPDVCNNGLAQRITLLSHIRSTCVIPTRDCSHHTICFCLSLSSSHLWQCCDRSRNCTFVPREGICRRGYIVAHILKLGTRWNEWSASCPGCFTPQELLGRMQQEAEWTPGPVWIICKLFCFYVFVKLLVYFNSDGSQQHLRFL